MPLLDTDQMAAGRRFEPSASRNRKTKRGGPRKFQSLWNISQLSDQQPSGIPVTTETTTQAEPTGSTAAAIATNLNKRLPKWLRWGASKKSSAETKMEGGPNKVESVLPETLVGEHQGFIGNLGIGGFIETEESTFVTSDEVDEPNVLNTTGTNQTKSLMNLSSLLLWPSQDDTAVGQTTLAPAASPGLGRTQERYSLSTSSRNTSSVEGSPCSWNSTGPNEVLRSRVLSDPRTPSSDQSCVIPELIKVLFLTNTPLGRVLMDVDTLRLTTAEGTRKPLDFVKLITPLPAWFIHENSPLIPNMTYWLYRTSDYRDELARSIRWVEDRLHLQRRSRPATRKRSPSAPRFTADHRARRLTSDSTSTGKQSSHSPNNNTSSPDQEGDRSASNIFGDRSEGPTSCTLPGRTELEAILRVLNEASRFMDMVQPKSVIKSNPPTGENSAIVLRNSGINTSFPSAHQLVLPQMENFPMCELQAYTDLRKIVQEDVGLLFKIPMNSADPLSLDEIKFTEHTLWLSSNSVLISEEPIQQQDSVTPVRFKQILPLTQTWCHVMQVQSSGNSSSVPFDWVKLSANISSLPAASLTQFGKLSGTTYDGLAARLFQDAIATADSRMPTGDEENNSVMRVIWIGCPPVHNWLLKFSAESVGDNWIVSLQELLNQNQKILEGRSLCVKILNEVTDNQVVYKYHNVRIDTMAFELKEKALGSMNIKGHSDCHMLVRYHPTVDGERDFLLTGYESPFLIALSLTLKLCGDLVSGQSESSQSVPPSPTHNSSFNPGSTTTANSSGASSAASKSSETKPGKIYDILKKHEDELREAQSSPMDFETFVRQLPPTDPIIPRDQLRVEFVLHARSSSATKQNRRVRHGGIVKPSDLKRASPSAVIASRSAKNRGKLREKTKSTVHLNTISQTASQSIFPLRGARSMGSLNSDVKVGEIFGQVPEDLWPELSLPRSLMSLFVIVYYTGFNVEGIFRRTAVNRQIYAMREKVDENIEPITPSICPPILAACVLKKFFHEIPGHVLGDENWDDWVEILRIPTITERVEAVQRLIRRLPKANQALLRLLIYLLSHIRDHEASNRMSIEALGTVWGANLIQRPGKAPSPTDSKLACRIVEYLLEPQMTNSVLREPPEAVSELQRLFETKWDSLNEDDAFALSTPPQQQQQQQRQTQQQQQQQDSGSTHSDLGRSIGTSVQESFTEQTGSHEEHSLSSSIHLSRSELSSLDETASRKYLHSHSSLLSTTTSSSAESQNASPVLNETRPFYSPMMNDKRRANCMPRRKLVIRTENTLPDQMSPPMTSVSSYTDAETVPESYIMREPRRVRKQVSLPVEEDHAAVGIIPPPVPPRKHSRVIRMPETRLVSDVTGLSPPIPPKPKPRQKPNELSSQHRIFAVDQPSPDRITNFRQDEKLADSSNLNDRNTYTGTQRTTRRIIYSRVTVANPVSLPTRRSVADYPDFTQAAREAARYSSSIQAGEHRVRDRRHSSADRSRASGLRDRGLQLQNAPHISNIMSTAQTPSLPAQTNSVHRMSKVMSNVQSEGIETPYVLEVPVKKVSTEPCERRHLSLNNDNANRSPDQMTKQDWQLLPTQPDSFDWIAANSPESIHPPRRQAIRFPSVSAHRPQSIDRFYMMNEPKVSSIPPIDPSRQANTRGGPLKRSDSETDRDTRALARCVRRMSSHASTVSSESNTLVSTSSEQIS